MLAVLNTVDDNVGDLVAIIGRVKPSIDPDRCAAIDLDVARYDGPFPIGPAPQRIEACAAEGGGIADGDGRASGRHEPVLINL